MKKETKRILAGAMCLTMLGVSGCGPKKGENADGENQKLRVFFMDSKTPDVDMVAEKVSEITREKIGADVEFVMLDDYGTKLPMMIATDEPMDICWVNSDDLSERARKGAYADLTELLDTTPDLKALFEDDFWKGVTINGHIYAIPTKKEMAEQWVCYAEEDFLKQSNITIDPNKIYSFKELEPILEKLKETGTRNGFEIGAKGQHNAMHKLNYFDTITGDFVVDKKTNKVQNYYMTSQFEEYIRLMRDWYNKGYIASDVATRGGYKKEAGVTNGISYVSYAPYNEVQATKYNKGVAVTPIKMTPCVITNQSTCGSAFAVLEKCKNKELAMKFLELWNTDPDVKNLITHGIEGVHYNLVDGKVEQVEGATSKYLNQNWASGNVFISKLYVGEPDDKWEKYDEFNKSATKSLTLGFFPEVKMINDKILACQGAAAEFTGLLSCGAVDPDEYLPKLKSSLEASGVNDVVKELQKQYDEWSKN